MSNILREAQLKMLEALIELSAVCEENNIQYWLDSGTLLGAIRHQGFIPWDDDVDICMSREDFNKFVEIGPKILPNNLFVQTLKSDRYYRTWSIPCKVRIGNTLIQEKSAVITKSYNEKSNNGLFIDIFPMDYLPKNKSTDIFIKNLNRIYACKYANPNFGFKTFRLLCKVIGSIFPLAILEKIKSQVTSSLKGDIIIYGVELPFKRRFFQQSDIFPLKKIKFEGHEFLCPNNPDIYLRKLYGDDYMTPPPVKNRVNHYHKIEIY